MTEADLLGDLARLLREGLVQVDQDGGTIERFAVTRRGRTVADDPDPLRDEAQTTEFVDVADGSE